MRWAARRVLARTPSAQAGFFFTIQTVFRRAPHRSVIAMSIAAGLAGGLVSLHGIDLGRVRNLPSVPLDILAMQTLAIVALTAGLRHAIRIPADVAANVIFRVVPLPDKRLYVRGVEYAALVVVVTPVLLCLLPGFAWAIGIQRAVDQLAIGVGLALMFVELMLLVTRPVPFALPYAPPENLKLTAPFYAIAFVVVAYGVAWIVQLTLDSVVGTAAFTLTAATCLLVMRYVAHRRLSHDDGSDPDEAPAPATQRLNLGHG